MNFVAALLYAVSSSAMVALGLGFLYRGLHSASSGVALGVGSLVGAVALWNGRGQRGKTRPPTGWEWAPVLLFTLASARSFFWLVFADGNQIKVLSPNNLGDFALHLSYIRYFASGVPFWPENPIFGLTPLTYPVGVDLFHTLLILVGVDVWRAFIWVGLAGAAATGMALWRWGRGVALMALLANGGLMGFAFFSTGKWIDFQSGLAWKNLFLSCLVTQRGLLFALPAGLLLLVSWRARFFAVDDTGWRLPRWGEVLLYASLPLFHLHTFIFLSLLLGCWFALSAVPAGPLLRLVGLAFAPATALVYLVTGGGRGSHILGLKLGWMWNDGDWLKWCGEHLPGPPEFSALLFFLPMNFGLLIPLVAVLGWVLVRDRHAFWARMLYFPALGIFLLCCVVKFAPWEWDNTKIMLWSYLAILPLAWERLIAARPLCQRAAAAFLLFWSGFASLLGGLSSGSNGYDLTVRNELDGVRAAVADLPLGASFAAYPTYNHLLLLSGRPVALGYPGHAWSHGLAWKERQDAVDSLLNGEPGWRETATALGVRYVFWGTQEHDHYPASTEPWAATSRLVRDGFWGEIYDLEQPPDP